MSIRNLIESAIKGDALSFNETFTGIMGEAAIVAVEDYQNPVTADDVVDVLIGLGVLTIEETESEDFTEETLLELSKASLKNLQAKPVDYAFKKKDKKLTKEETEVTEEAIALDELSKKTLGSYIKKASAEIRKNDEKAEYHNSASGNAAYHSERANKLKNKANDREVGVHKALGKLTKEETQIDELSNATLGSYVRKSSKQAVRAATMTNQGKNKDMEKIMNKRLDGVERAAGQIQNKKD